MSQEHDHSAVAPNSLTTSPWGTVPATNSTLRHGFNSYGNHHSNLAEDETGFDFMALVMKALRYRWLIVAILAIGTCLAILITWTMTPQYRAASRLEIITQSAKVVEDLQVFSDSGDLRAAQTAVEKLKSRSLANRVSYQLNLANKPDFLFPRESFAFANLWARASGQSNGPQLLQEMPLENRVEKSVNLIKENLSVRIVGKTNILEIAYVHANPDRARDVANQVAQSFMDQRVDQTSETSSLARSFIKDQVAQVKQSLQESEEALVAYAKKVGITLTGEETSLIAGNLKEINLALSKAIQDRLNLKRQVEQIKSGGGASLPQVIDSEGIGRMRDRVAELKAEYQQKRATLKPGFPEMRKLSAQIRETERQAGAAVRAITRSVELQHNEAIQREEDLRAKLKELEVEQSTFQDKRIQYTILKREVDSNRSQYDTLIGKLNSVGVGAELKDAKAQIVDPAVRPGAPVSPSLLRNLLLGFGLASIFAAAAVYILELLNDTFTTPDQIEEELKLAVLGILPKVPEAELKEQLGSPTSPISEAYRSLRTALQFSGPNGLPSIVAMTSSQPSEGKSTTIMRLAEDFAAIGSKVLIIDCDMRRPNIHRLLGTNNLVGLSNVLTDTVSKENSTNVFRDTNMEGVTAICAGPIPPNPADLLSSSRMASLINLCDKRFDLILLDSPPVIGIADATIVAQMAEATVFMVSSNDVTRKAAKIAIQRLRSTGGNVIGAVMSKFAVSRYDYSYNYKYMNLDYALEGGATSGQNSLARDNASSTGNSNNEKSGNPLHRLIGLVR